METKKVTSKICSKCGIEKVFSEFNKHSGCKFGVRSNCRMCENAQHKKYLADNNKEINERRAKYRDENREKIRKQDRDFHERHRTRRNEEKKVQSKIYREKYPERREESQRKYVENNPEKVKESGLKYYYGNRESISNKIADRTESDPVYKIKKILRAAFGITTKRDRDGEPIGGFNSMFDNMDDYIEHFRKSFLWPDYCRGVKLSIDHIIPVSIYDFNNIEHIKKCWHYRNLRLLSQSENSKKHNKIDMDLIKFYGIEDLMPDGMNEKENEK